MRDGDGRIDAWDEIEEMIAREAEKRFGAQMFDQSRAKAYALEYAATIVRAICGMLPGARLYVPKISAHQREARNEQIRAGFNGLCRETAHEVGLSSRHVRRIVKIKK
jgi:Mor family transcriptional regulator